MSSGATALLKAPFPWFGGKSRVADIVWDRFGNVPNYVEPFFGSGAVLLGRPSTPSVETINDIDCYVANFWRALQHDPEAVTAYADWPVNEADQDARHLWLAHQADFRERLKSDPDFYDAKIAGWWVWGISSWIGGGWCRPSSIRSDGTPCRKLPHLSPGRGVHRQLPLLGDAGTALLGYMRALADRLRRVRVCCGDWARVCGPSPTIHNGLTGIFLDPPYSAEAGHRDIVYASDDFELAQVVCRWAIANGDNPDLRIALCGYEGEYQMPDSWECVAWKAQGGYSNIGNNTGRDNAYRERIWFSPFCEWRQIKLFERAEAESA